MREPTGVGKSRWEIRVDESRIGVGRWGRDERTGGQHIDRRVSGRHGRAGTADVAVGKWHVLVGSVLGIGGRGNHRHDWLESLGIELGHGNCVAF